MKKRRKRRRREPIPRWKYRLLWTFVAILLILTVANMDLILDIRADAIGVPFEKSGMSCTEHLKSYYCCDGKSFDVMYTNLATGRKFNLTTTPDCYKVQINGVIK